MGDVRVRQMNRRVKQEVYDRFCYCSPDLLPPSVWRLYFSAWPCDLVWPKKSGQNWCMFLSSGILTTIAEFLSLLSFCQNFNVFQRGAFSDVHTMWIEKLIFVVESHKDFWVHLLLQHILAKAD